MALSITISGTERRDSIPLESIEINNVLTRQIDTARFVVVNASAYSLKELDEVIISDSGTGTRHFAGVIEKLEETEAESGINLDYRVNGVDYTWLLEHPEQLVNTAYEDQTDQAMIQDFMPAACPDIEVTTYVKELYTYDGVVRLARMTPRDIIERFAEAAGGDYYVDYGPTSGTELAHLRFFDSEEYKAPFGLSDSPDMSTTYPYERLVYTTHAPAANIVEVVGGMYLSADQTLYWGADGEQAVIPLPYRVRAQEGESKIAVYVNTGDDTTPVWSAQNVGTKYLHDDELGTTYDVLYAYSEKYLEFNTAPSNLDKAVRVDARYEVPVRVRVRSYESYDTYGRWITKRLVDKSINSKALARRRAKKMLADEAIAKPRLTLTTRQVGLKAGQFVTLISTLRNIDDEFLIQRVRTRFEAGGDVAVCDLELGVYDPDLIDLILSLKHDEDVQWSEEDQLDELLERRETFGLDDTASAATATGTSYDWAPASAGDDPLIWSFGRWS